MTERAVASVLLLGCVVALLSGFGLAEAEERARGQVERLHDDLDEPVQHKVSYMGTGLLRERPFDQAAGVRSSAILEPACGLLLIT